MIKEVTFKNFRRFDDLRLPLARVTVLTGVNGVGKTTVLEGLYCLFSETKLDVLPLSRYAKTLGVTINQSPVPHMPFGVFARPNINYHLFWRECPIFDQAECSVGALSDNGLEWLWTYQKANASDLDKALTDNYHPIDSTVEFALWNWSKCGEQFDPQTEQSSIIDERFQRAQFLSYTDGLFFLPQTNLPSSIKNMSLCRYLEFSTLRVSPNKLSFELSKSLTQALRIINPHVTDVRLIDNEGGLSVILDDKYSVSLGAIGNGAVTLVSALLVIVDLIEQAQKVPTDAPVFLLIDEMGAGIHYSIMLAVWKHIRVLMNGNQNIQFVFTTHSNDCIRAFCEEFVGSDAAKIVRLHQTKTKNMIVPTVYCSEDNFGDIIEDNMEVRG